MGITFRYLTYAGPALHHDVIKWAHFPRYWPFVWEMHRLPVNSFHKDQWHGALVFYFDFRLTNRLSKQSICRWFGTLSRSLWRYCNGRLMYEYRWCAYLWFRGYRWALYMFKLMEANEITAKLVWNARAPMWRHSVISYSCTCLYWRYLRQRSGV